MQYQLNFEAEPFVGFKEVRGTRFWQQTEENLELESTVPRPTLIAWLTWQPNNENPRLYTRAQALKLSEMGVYIAVRVQEQKVGTPPTLRFKEILKAGESSREPFSSRITKDVHSQMDKEVGDNLRYFFATITASAADAGGSANIVEHLIIRTLYRAGVNMRYHGIPYKLVKATGQIRVENILPKQLRRILERAYRPTLDRDPRKQAIGPVPVPGVIGPLHQLFLEKGTEW